jgi:hypothetical protein
MQLTCLDSAPQEDVLIAAQAAVTCREFAQGKTTDDLKKPPRHDQCAWMEGTLAVGEINVGD